MHMRSEIHLKIPLDLIGHSTYYFGQSVDIKILHEDDTLKNTPTTRELLIESAGELFADSGFEAVSTRMIADKAGVKLSAIHYHFGTKENLYSEACITSLQRSETISFALILNENPGLMATPAGQAEIIRTQVFRSFHHFHRAGRPEWETKIILREIVNPTTAMERLVEESFKPDVESSMNFYQQINPGATDEEAAAWSDLLYGPLIFYKVAHQAIQMTRPNLPLDDAFFQTTATKLARAMILEAGLPLPADLQE